MRVSVADRFAPSYKSWCFALPVFTTSSFATFQRSSCFWLFSCCADRQNYFSRWALVSKVSVVVFKIISVTDRPPSSCFVAGFQVMTVAGRLAANYFVTVHWLYRYSVNIISVADHFAPSFCFVQLFSRLIASRRIVLSLNFCRMLGNCFVVV